MYKELDYTIHKAMKSLDSGKADEETHEVLMRLKELSFMLREDLER